MAEDDARNPNGTWKRGQPAGREVAAIVAVATQLDAAERALLTSGIGKSAVRDVMRQFPGITRKHANRLMRAVQMRWQYEAKHTTREARKALVRQRLEQVYRLAIEYKDVAITSDSEGAQSVEYVDAPDLKAAGDVLAKLIALDQLHLVVDDPGDPGDERERALRGWAEAYGAPALGSGSEEG
jgi:hypothetical protein